jgi:hypothetical protein
MEESFLAVSEPHGEKRIRSGAMLFRLATRPGHYTLVATPFDAVSLGLTTYDPGRLGAQEHGEAQAEAPRPAPPRLPRETISHAVVEGETLIAVARRFAIDVEDAARDNDVAIHAPLRPGTSLRLRILPARSTPTPTRTPGPPSPPRGSRGTARTPAARTPRTKRARPTCRTSPSR